MYHLNLFSHGLLINFPSILHNSIRQKISCHLKQKSLAAIKSLLHNATLLGAENTAMIGIKDVIPGTQRLRGKYLAPEESRECILCQ